MKNVIASFSLIAAVILLLASKFTLAVPSQEYSCLFARYFLVDKTNITIKRDRLVAFNLPVDTPYFQKGSRWIKKLVGVPGDRVIVRIDEVLINGKSYKNNMRQLLMKIELAESAITREFVLAEDEYFMVGETPLSYDSRFWGVVHARDMIGDAYAVL
ncbi:signal peptidase I [Shewanella sp. SM34]|uniref:signal peptidase I n=1 Tax=unclassified Shewanella TaxID=196818 RepID=UPI0021D8D560|nr:MULTISPECIES: signal peptidase I [unclassified Shewanella]MCU8056168.1 signal peptidase I [Shewanella sp. SM35]MCU8065102.1 signal peptidase I [Shewanella sp. SM34]